MEQKRKILIGNWKMNKNIKETIEFLHEVYDKVSKLDDTYIIGIAPSYLSLPIVRKMSDRILCISQNLGEEEKGAFTGEISISMLEEIGVEFSIVGHSERKQYFNETNVSINKKLKLMQEHNCNAILCVGETLEEYETKKSEEVVETQILEAIDGLSNEYISSLVIAYEPVWAIGSGKSATLTVVKKMVKSIIETIKNKYGEEVSDKVYIIYGGSVDENSIYKFVKEKDIDGVLVGSASLSADKFIKMIDKLKEVDENGED